MVGPNGAGKSTLFKGIVGALKPLSGAIDRDGLDPHEIAYLPQTAEIDRTFPITVYDMVAMGLWRQAGPLRRHRHDEQRDRIEQALAAVGLTGFENRAIGTLSGGQMQRMLFARLLLQDARVIVLDEPFNAIDAKTSRRSARSGAALARREAHRARGAARHRSGARRISPRRCCWRASRWPGARRRRCSRRKIFQKARRMCEAFDEDAGACAA